MSIKTYANAINEAQDQLLKNFDNVFLIGQGVESPWYVGNTMINLVNKYGDQRVIDTPISEAAVTGAAIGAAMTGMYPIIFHTRISFVYLALDQIINHCSLWNYMFDGKVSVPVVIRTIVNRGSEQAAQHTQSPLSLFAHIPGLKVVCPSSAYDAKGLLIAAALDPNPVIYIDDRWLYDNSGEVPDELYISEIGKGKVCRAGQDITIITTSYLVIESLKAAEILKERGIDIEVIDIVSAKPLDINIITKSAIKTGKAVVAVGDWPFGGLASHITSLIYNEAFCSLKKPVVQVTYPDSPIPASAPLENAYFPKCESIIAAVEKLL